MGEKGKTWQESHDEKEKWLHCNNNQARQVDFEQGGALVCWDGRIGVRPL